MTAYPETRHRRREGGIATDGPLCSKCDQPNDRHPQRYCTACNRTYQREWKRGRAMVPIEIMPIRLTHTPTRAR